MQKRFLWDHIFSRDVHEFFNKATKTHLKSWPTYCCTPRDVLAGRTPETLHHLVSSVPNCVKKKYQTYFNFQTDIEWKEEIQKRGTRVSARQSWHVYVIYTVCLWSQPLLASCGLFQPQLTASVVKIMYTRQWEWKNKIKLRLLKLSCFTKELQKAEIYFTERINRWLETLGGTLICFHAGLLFGHESSDLYFIHSPPLWGTI